ncbi:MAG: hypothetical protein P0120_23955 [Nitrospira sp.]|nr:hypothetical protein [Nitrospira sp.]
MTAATEGGGGWDATAMGIRVGVGDGGGVGGSVDAGIGDDSDALTDSGRDGGG